ncbi:hypothetical protein A0H81_02717 [Grifola frondosa]|uniref:Uncharacterized protein n=1 Tax=Grifola frondosa TaxID=5627 RepID=A0A1C7MMT4_GRIFR|nr:hypothetical protein A0H81_02717 [Grifola frondosa]
MPNASSPAADNARQLLDDSHSDSSKQPSDSQAWLAGYKPIFGSDDGTKSPIPSWLPVSLLALTTAALAVPIVILRRQRASALGKALANAPPPPRRTSSGGAPLALSGSSLHPPLPPRPPSAPSASASTSAARVEDDFNGALHCAGAFGVATLLVVLGAGAGVWGVRSYMGVQDTQEFADRMRHAVLTRMPMLSARIHRPPEPEDDTAIAIVGEDPVKPAHVPPRPQVNEEDATKWSWSDAEERLKDAFEKDGFSGWSQAALRELETEGELERIKRGHI